MSTVQVVQSGIVTTDSVREIGECFSQIGQGVHRWCQHGTGWRTDVKLQILGDGVQKRTRTQKRKVVEAIVETSKALSVTERRVRSDESESHQEEVKKPEEQASVVTQTAEFPESASTTVDSMRQVEVNVCKDDHEEKNCEVRWRYHQEGDELAREQFRRFGREVVRRPSVFSKYVDAQH